MPQSTEQLLQEIEQLKARLEDAEQLIDAIKLGEVDAFAIGGENQSVIYTLQSGDYAYRVLIEEFGEGALNVTADGLIVYTNRYFCELMGQPYEKIIGSDIADYIDGNSADIFKALFSAALHGRSKGEINMRAQNGLTPVYISLTSMQPDLPTVGIIITDITDKKRHEKVILEYQENLEAKNMELLESNAELASFAFVASHDLQEPLRKIQTFCNRIKEESYSIFADNTKDYFNRINGAAGRMQNLIVAILNYSRLNKQAEDFEKTDLNNVLEEVKAVLKETIEENGAVITVDKLPALTVIPYQALQLFTNLVGNAIKYRKKDVAPVIHISAGQVAHTDDMAVMLKPGRYWQIQFADNGQGFSQIYADKIFELFQRLHSKNEYDGTGIGLAICKKIMQNHGGYITAGAVPGQGATFTVYLPITLH